MRTPLHSRTSVLEENQQIRFARLWTDAQPTVSQYGGIDGKEVSAEETDERAGVLHFAAFHRHSELLQLLIDLGADITLPAIFEGMECSPVTFAGWQGDPATLKVILDAANSADIKLDHSIFAPTIQDIK